MLLTSAAAFLVGLLVGRLVGSHLSAWRVVAVAALVAPVTSVAVLSPIVVAVWGVCAARMMTGPRPTPSFVVAALGGLLVVDVVALLHSPLLGYAVRPISAAITLLLVAALVAADEDTLRTAPDDAMLVVKPVLALQAVSTVLFRLSPTLETRYLGSDLAPVIIGDRARQLFTTEPDNVLLDDKAGGLMFTNGNVASMVLAFFGLFLLSQYLRVGRWGSAAVGLLCLVGALATGSKTATLLALAAVPAILLLATVLWVRRSTVPLGIALICLPGGALAGLALYENSGALAEDSAAAAGVRSTLWDTAWTDIALSPVLGSGYGGWQLLNERSGNGLDPALPPHNYLLYAWLQAGVVAPLIVVAILAVLIWQSVALAGRSAGPRVLFARLLWLAAPLWAAAHGLYDVTDFFGSVNTIPFFVVVLLSTDHAYRRRDPDDAEEARAPRDPDDRDAGGVPRPRRAGRGGVGVDPGLLTAPLHVPPDRVARVGGPHR